MNKTVEKRKSSKRPVNIMTPDEVYVLSCIVRKFYGRYFAFPCDQLVAYDFNDVKDETITIRKEEIDSEGKMSFSSFTDTVYELRRKKAYPYKQNGMYDKNLIVGFLNWVEGDMKNTWVKVQVSRKIIPYIVRKCVETPVNVKENVEWR